MSRILESPPKIPWRIERWLVCLVALGFGIWFIGPGNVLPTSTAWLKQGDIGTQQAAWQYFRNSPLVQWPVTAIPQYGEGWGTVVPGSAGNALTAIPLKYVTRWLPGEFQYFGLWIALSFLLQAYVGIRIFGKFRLNSSQRILGALLLVLSPVFLFRLGMSHPDLASHWLLLLALLLFVAESRHWPWLALLSGALFVALYLFAMIFGVWVAWLIQRNIVDRVLVRRPPDWGAIARNSAVGLVTVLASLWFLGFFSFAGDTKGTGFFRLNVLALVNPDFSGNDSYSLIGGRVPYIQNRQLFAEEGEGFAYLGTLSIAVIPLLCWAVFRHRVAVVRRFTTLGVVVALFAAMAVSNRVVIGRSEFTYWLPDLIVEMRQVFRATTRFIWPLSYLLIIGGWVALCHLSNSLKPRLAVTLLSLALVLHAVDSSPGIAWAHERISARRESPNALVSPEWNRVFAQRSSIALVPTIDLQIDSDDKAVQAWIDSGRWIDVLNFASVRDVALNFAYQGRPRGTLADRITELNRRDLSSGSLKPGVVYVFSTESEWEQVRTALGSDALASIIDGYHVILGPENSGASQSE